MKTEDVMAKAVQAVASARVLLNTGDADGACNRAYYAMFDAALAALLASGLAVGKTHKGVLNAFSEHLVKNGPLPKEVREVQEAIDDPRPSVPHDQVAAEWATERAALLKQAELAGG